MKKSSNGKKGGLLVGKTDKYGGKGIPAEVVGGRKVILGGGEVIINEDAAAANCEILNKINQSTGGREIPCDLQKEANTSNRMSGGGSVTNTELNKALSDLHKAKTLQKMMKDANAIIRSKKNVHERLVNEVGWSESIASSITAGDRYGRFGFPTYQLTNNNASIKRLQDRVNMLQKKVEGAAKVEETGEADEYTFTSEGGGRILINYDIDRVQVIFPTQRVPAELYKKMRSNGFVFSPTNKAFQRKITPQGIRTAVRMFDAVKVASELEKGVEAEQEHLSTLEKVAAGDLTPKEAVVEIAQTHIDEKRFPELELTHPLNILEPESNQYQEALKEYRGVPVSFTDKKGRKPNRSMIDELHPLDLWVEFTDGRFYRKFEFPKSQMGIMREITDMGVKESLTDRKDGGTDAVISVHSFSEAANISDEYMRLIPHEDQVIKMEEPTELERLKTELAKAEKLQAKPSFTGDVSSTIERYKKKIAELEKVRFSPGDMVIFTDKLGKEWTVNFRGYMDGDKKAVIWDRKDLGQMSVDVSQLKPSTKEKTLGETSGGFIVEYADVEGEIISELENHGEMTTSDAQGVLEANEEFAKEYFGLGFSGREIAEKILAKGTPLPVEEEESFLDQVKRDAKSYSKGQSKKTYVTEKITGATQITEKYTWNDQADIDHLKETGRLNEYKILATYDNGELIEVAKKSPNIIFGTIPKHEERAFQGVNHDYKNQYLLNKAIEELLSQKAFDYTSDEKNFIRKYSGYGGLDKYGPTGKGGLFEYYTPKEVIEKMWGLAYKYGYNDGSVLEPSIATGEFLQYAPKDAKVVGYEINNFSAQICKILYPTTVVYVEPFEKQFIKNNFTVKDKTDHLEKFDLVIGNPPYGDFSVVESRYMSGMGEKDHTKARNYVEYFIRRGLDLVKPGGLLIYIVGSQIKYGGRMFLDTELTPVKEYLAANCTLETAYRLPDSVFERTGVTADIIVLKKNS